MAAVILCGAFKSDIDYNNPFLSVLLDMVESYSTNTIEKSILSKLLRSNRYYNEVDNSILLVSSEHSTIISVVDDQEEHHPGVQRVQRERG